MCSKIFRICVPSVMNAISRLSKRSSAARSWASMHTPASTENASFSEG